MKTQLELPATSESELRCKIATEDAEFEQIHRLNHRTFAEEIAQHAPQVDGRLVDRFHAENTYWIARQGRRVVGMLAVRTQRPFSLDAKLPQLDRFLPRNAGVLEVRLLAVEPEYRRGPTCALLFQYVVEWSIAAGFELAVISGTTRQIKLYRHLGFVPFGPLVGHPGAWYQPMYLTLRAVGRSASRGGIFSRLGVRRKAIEATLNLLPGPVGVSPAVQAALAEPICSHRGPEFAERLREVRLALCHLTGAAHVQVMPGSGSLANGVVAAQLKTSGLPGGGPQ